MSREKTISALDGNLAGQKERGIFFFPEDLKKKKREKKEKRKQCKVSFSLLFLAIKFNQSTCSKRHHITLPNFLVHKIINNNKREKEIKKKSRTKETITIAIALAHHVKGTNQSNIKKMPSNISKVESTFLITTFPSLPQ